MLRFLFVVLLVPTLAWSAPGDRRTTLDVKDAGAVGDGATINTSVLQKTIDKCSAEGGGTLVFPEGRYVTGTIQLKDNVFLHLKEGAVLLGSTRSADYLNVDPFMAGDGVPLGYALIVALEATHVGIEGPGTIDGQGKALKAAQSRYDVRPFLIRWIRCTDVSLQEVRLSNPGAWTNHFFQCRDVKVRGVTIRSYGSGLVNNDGIDIDSCETVRITDCDIESGDDAICVKATSAKPSRDITVAHCKLKTDCNAIKFGTESLGDFEKVRITDISIRETGMAGIALYSVDGAHLHDVIISDITMDGITVPVSVRLGARLKTFRPDDQKKEPGTLRDVTIKNVRVKGAKRIGLLINGVPGHPVESLNLENIEIELPGGGTADNANIQLAEKESAYPEMSMFGKTLPAYGLYLRHARNVTFKNIHLSAKTPDARPEKILVDVEGISPADFMASADRPESPAPAKL